MSDRSEALLAELVDLQRQYLANQERALAQQSQSFALQQEGLARYRASVRIILGLIAATIGGIVMVSMLSAGR